MLATEVNKQATAHAKSVDERFADQETGRTTELYEKYRADPVKRERFKQKALLLIRRYLLSIVIVR